MFHLRFVGFADILSRVGGLSGSILPVMRLLGPWLVLIFLVQLCGIIVDYKKKQYK
jgi:hypothetical protein